MHHPMMAIQVLTLAEILEWKKIFSVELTIPADFIESHTQTEWDNISAEMGYKSVTLNPDGSVTYKMTKKQHEEIIEETGKGLNMALQEMVGSEEYPNFTNINIIFL